MHDLLVDIAEAMSEAALPDRDSPRWYWRTWLAVLAAFVGLIVWFLMS
ncbi:hypothetical protein ACU5AX_03395 [Sphingomonas sp. XXL09]